MKWHKKVFFQGDKKISMSSDSNSNVITHLSFESSDNGIINSDNSSPERKLKIFTFNINRDRLSWLN